MKRTLILSNKIFLILLASIPNFALLGIEIPKWVDLFNGKDLAGWLDVNTSPETWSVKNGMLICKGKPIGVMRSERQYENFLLHVE
ncbi:MAG: DUF1080 domain-containing protein, partial [Opitutae bacterium]|nr:DUF1080 domain-containing protein [Opitutae bacterium]